MRIGFIGLGVMGRPMARHILGAGGAGDVVAVTGRGGHERFGDLVDAGALWCDTGRTVAAGSDVVVLIPPTIADVRAILEGPDGVLAGVDRQCRIVVSSTTSPQEVRDLDPWVRETTGGLARIVDAPVSGGSEGAEAGTLSVMVGGADEDAAVVVGALSPTGRAVHLGPLGAGQVAKACNQLIVAAQVVALAEASLIAERAGIDVAALFDLLKGGYAGSRIMEVKAWRFATHDHSPSGPAKFMIKDLRAVAEEADRSGLALNLVAPLREVFGNLTDDGLGDLDTSVVQQYVESRSEPGTAQT